MGIYIPNLKMPKEIDPTLVIDFCEDLSDRRYARFYHYRYGGLTNWYEVLEIQEPHGRLIDVDKLGIRDEEKQAYDALQKEKGEFFTEETLIEYLRGRCDGLIHASGLVRFAPTIIPASEEGET